MIVPSPSTLVVRVYFFFIKLAVTDLSESIITETVSLLPEAAPVHLSNTNSAVGAAVIDTCCPSSTVPPFGFIVPLFAGITLVVKVYFIVSLEQDITNKTENSKSNFLIT